MKVVCNVQKIDKTKHNKENAVLQAEKYHFNKHSQFITTLGQKCLKYNPEPCNVILVQFKPSGPSGWHVSVVSVA